MIIMPPLIKKCSSCCKLIEQATIASGNTFGAIFWTDGKREAPMLPDQLWLVICPHCRSPLWLDELEEDGQTKSLTNEANRPIRAIPYIAPSFSDYHTLLEEGLPTKEKESYLRLRAWWSGNDTRRTTGHEIPLNANEKLNLEHFSQMLDESIPRDVMMKAEVMRELGRFSEAGALLEKVEDEGLVLSARIIQELIDSENSYVREMDFG